MTEETAVTASISGVTLASLLTGLPRVGPAAAFPSRRHPGGSVALDPHDAEPQGSVPSVQGGAEGLLLGSFLELRMQREHRDMGTPTHVDVAERPEGDGSDALWPSLSSASAEWAEGEGTQPEVVIERFWESLPGSFPGRLVDAAGAVNSGAVAESLLVAANEAQGLERSKGSKAKDKSKEKQGGEVAALRAEELGSVVGWYVRRRGRPMRPSMREVAGTVALQRWLRARVKATSRHSEQGLMAPEHPILFLLLSTSEDARGCIHTSSFRLFALDPSWHQHLAQGGAPASHANGSISASPPLAPIPLKVSNLGNIARPQYSVIPAGLESFRGLSSQGRDAKAQGRARKGQRLDFGSGGVMSAMAQQSRQQVAGLEDVYGAVLEQLTALCDDVSKAKNALDARASEQEP